jgi:hypothetical protein
VKCAPVPQIARKKTPGGRGKDVEAHQGLEGERNTAEEEIGRHGGAPAVSSGGGAVEEWRSSGERCGVERRWCCPFIGRRGKGKGRGEAVAARSVGGRH